MMRIDPTKMPPCEMARVILHWTAGTYKASALDREHYHVLIEGDGTVVYGKFPIDANTKPACEPRASHTRNCNTGSIGVAVCCMKDARERPFSTGPFPMTIEQWKVAAEVVAELCARYAIDVTPKTVLAHGEVQATLKIEQLQKWDPLVLPWAPTTPRQQVMDQFRAAVHENLARLVEPSPLATRATPAAPEVPAGFELQSKKWTGDCGVLLVHGVGNAKPGDYTDIAQAVAASMGPDCAVYSLFYDVFNDWLAEKTQFATQIGRLTALLKLKQGNLPDGVAEFAADVMWPLFSVSARTAIKTAYIAQLRQMVLDGTRSTGKLPGELKFSIICHSLGCFHTYEVLHSIAIDPMLNLRPFTDGVRFRSVVFMASPVQLIRTLATGANALVLPGLASTVGTRLGIPFETALGITRKSVSRWVSVTGDLDPIGGHFLRQKAPWAYMDVTEPEAISFVDQQTLVGSGDVAQDLRALLLGALRPDNAPLISVNNPHSWLAYLQRHQAEISTWFA